MSDAHEDTVALSAEDVAEITGEAEEADEAPDALRHPRDEPRAVTEPMYSTDPEADPAGESSGDFADDQAPEDREPRPGNAPAPGHRPSESGSTPSDIPTEADDDEHRDHAPGLRRERQDRG